MGANFYEYEKVWDAPVVPAWSYRWIAYDGCTGRYLTQAARTPPPGTQSLVLTTLPPDVTVVRRSPTIKGKRSSGPPFRHTPYSISRTRTVNQIVSRDRIAIGMNVYQQYGQTGKFGGTSCYSVETSRPCTGPQHSEYRWNRSYGTLSVGNPEIQTEVFDGQDVSDALEEVRQGCLDEALSTYDALTELSELHKVPSTITGIVGSLTSMLQNMNKTFGKRLMQAAYYMRPIDLLRHPQHLMRALGKQWMTYRYGIMPLVYSYRDLVKLGKRSADVTSRDSRTITPKRVEPDPPTDRIYLIRRDQGSIVVRACLFQSFSSSELAKLSGLTLNPLVTLWELTPYSWVADWVVDIGSYLRTLNTHTMAGMRWACLSRREKSTTGYWVSLPDESMTRTCSTYVPTNWLGPLPTTPSRTVNCPPGIFPLQTTEKDAYERWPVSIASERLKLNPSLNWKRAVDSAYLLNNFLGSILRSLRPK